MADLHQIYTNSVLNRKKHPDTHLSIGVFYVWKLVLAVLHDRRYCGIGKCLENKVLIRMAPPGRERGSSHRRPLLFQNGSGGLQLLLV